MEKEVEPQSARFFHPPNKEGALQINSQYFKEFLTELPKKLERDQDENIIHNMSISKDEASGMPFYKDFAVYYDDEYYWFSFFNCRNCENVQLSNLLSIGFSLCIPDEQKTVEPRFTTITEDAFIKTYAFYLTLTNNFEITYCHLFYLDRSKGGKNSAAVFQKTNEIRKQSISRFFTSIQLNSDNPPMVRKVSSSITIPSSDTPSFHGVELSPESFHPNKTLPRKGSSSRKFLRKGSNPPKMKSNRAIEPEESVKSSHNTSSKKPSLSFNNLPTIFSIEIGKSPRSPKGVASPKNSEGSETGSSQESPKGNAPLSENIPKDNKVLQDGGKEKKSS